jgi:uncharacterized protein (DUF2062 family)
MANVVAAIIAIVALALFLTFPFMWMWNYAVVGAITVTRPIDFEKALVLMLFISMFFCSRNSREK